MSRLLVGRRSEGRRARLTARRLALEPLESKTLLATFVVTSNADPDEITEGTLRWAVVQANESDDADSIHFNLPTNQRSIALTRTLPALSQTVTIDGTTQPGYSPGDPSTLVEVTYGADTGVADGFRINAGGSTIRALSITNFPGNGITITDADDNRIENNLIGVRPNQAAAGNEGHGILIQSSSRNRIGGEPARGNRISNNGDTSGFNGITIEVLGSGREAIDNRITYNTFSQNGGLAIDLGNDGVTPNDGVPDSDTGPNNLQNYPEIQLAATVFPIFQPLRTDVQTTFASAPDTTYLIQFFASDSADGSGFGEGAELVATRQINTDATGVASFLTTLNEVVATGRVITATATDPRGNTSEFSQAVEVEFITSRVDLGVSVTANPDPVAAGDPLTYVATVRNFNNNPAIFSGPAELVVNLPDNVTLDPSSVVVSTGTIQISANVIRASFGPLGGQQAETLTFDVIPNQPGIVQSNFAVTGGIADPNLGNNTATTITQVTLGEETSVLEFRVRNFSVGESGGFATIEVERSNSAAGTVSVDYETIDGTATAGVNYVATSGTLTFENNEVRKTFTIPIIDNDVLDPNRTVIVELSNPTGTAVIGPINRTTLTIFDNDPPFAAPQFLQFAQGQIDVLEDAGQVSIVVQRVGGSSGNVSIPYSTVAGSALPNRDFVPVSGTLTFLSGETEKTIVVPIIDNAILDGNLSFGVNLGVGIGAAPGNPSSVQVTIIDDESPLLGTFQFSTGNFTAVETDGTATITVTRQGGTGPATIGYATSPGTAVPGVRYQPVSGTLEFAEGETEKTFTVPVLPTEGFTEPQTVVLNLAVPEGGTLGTNGQAILTISDVEEAPASIVQFTTREIVVDETIGMATITINRLGLPIGSVSVNVFTNAGDAVPGVHYQPINTVVEFGPGETSKTVSIPILNNDVFDFNRAVGIFIADPVGNVLLGQPDSLVLIIRNTNPDPIVPFVADVQGVGPGGSINAISLFFNKAMDPSTLLRPTNYMVVAHGRDGILGTADDRVIPIAGLEVAPGALGVSVLLATPVPAGEFVSIGVNGFEGGLADTSGNLIDGNGDGLAGGNFSTVLGRASRITYRDHDGDLITYVVTGGGFVEVIRGTPGTGDIVRITNPVPGRSVLRGQVTRRPGGDGLAFIRRIEGIDPFGRVRSELRTPPFVDFSQITPDAVDALLASRHRPGRR